MATDIKLQENMDTNKEASKRVFFGSKNVNPKKKIANKKASLQACHFSIDPNSVTSELNPKRNNKKNIQRTFFLTPSCYQASMCVEASIAFSFFLLFLVNVFSVILWFRTYSENTYTLCQRGKQLAAYAYVTEGLTGSGEELIRLQKIQTMKSPFSILPTPEGKLVSIAVIKPWTGYDVTSAKNRKEEDIIVYMTQYGSVYHKDRGCTHLSLSIQSISIDEVGGKINWNEGHYSPCEYCGNHGFVTLVYITNYGDRYHTTIKCRGLRRYVKSVPLSQVEGIPPCQKCG